MAAKQRARGRTGLNEASIGELLKVRDKWCATTTPRQPISFVALKKLDWRPRPGCRAHIHENSERDFSGMGTGKKWKQRAKKLDEKSIGHVNDIMEKARTPLHCIRPRASLIHDQPRRHRSARLVRAYRCLAKT